MPIIYIAVLTIVAVVLGSEAAGDPKYVMPRELVQHAQSIGCKQVEDFFDVNGMIGPPYAYGYVPGSPEDSAVFWCERTKGGERQFLLAIRGKLGGVLACSQPIVSSDYPGGLEVYRNPNELLEEFRYVDSPNLKGPRGKGVMHNAIKSSVPGSSTTYYCHEGKWLFRLRH